MTFLRIEAEYRAPEGDADSEAEAPYAEEVPDVIAFARPRPFLALVKALVRRRNPDATDEQIDAALAFIRERDPNGGIFPTADTGRPFLDWLLNGGLEKLIELILKLLPLLGIGLFGATDDAA